jgi:hypothetical protein
MKDLTKKDIENIVKESNQDLVGESYTYLANDLSAERKEKLRVYSQFVEQARVLLTQMVKKASSDYETGNLQDADIDYLIDDQCQRMQAALDYTISSLEVIKGPGIETDTPGLTYPNFYDE